MRALSSIFVFFGLALSAHAGITQQDFTGTGNIYVLNSTNWPTASPTNDKIGCLSELGKLISTESKEGCGVFTRADSYPYTLSTKEGNCTFTDKSQERNTDSKYGKLDYAWNCNSTYDSVIYDQLYTITGFPHVFLCFGDVACYYDAKKAPGHGDILSLWQFHWGSQQMDITPGHIQLLLMWNKIEEPYKRKGSEDIPGPRLRLTDGMQEPLLGLEQKS
ncbi:hypothetical protein E8E13_002639 [Curvularia kusanoi]|uniref:Secreted protein n=1 Tax=Curvularia kusanoi TaxID=90978 RepID=A0A9P4TDE2_CURKU|nr:hypothetical protein E8E13_002639 [Curvularia kusanoi]